MDRKKAAWASIVLLSAGLAAAFALRPAPVAAPAPGPGVLSSASTTTDGGTKPKAITLAFAGDVMFARGVARTVEKRGGDYSYMFSLLGGEIRDADIAFANLETSVSERGTNVGSIYSFRSDPKALDALKDAGFDVVSVANNHIWDWGEEAFTDTLLHLKYKGIASAGGGFAYDGAHFPALIERSGVTVAYLAYTNLLPRFLLGASSSPAVAFPTEAALRADVARAKAVGADVVVTSFHWGEEYATAHNAYQERMAKAAIDAGALIVAGHHPHVIQEVERYKEGLIIYSLGNFIFDQNFDELTSKGLVVGVAVEDGKITAVERTVVGFDKTYRPYAASGE